METSITAHENLGLLDSDTLNRIIYHERETYGYEDYGEYLFCKNAECRRVLSIDEVYQVADTSKQYIPIEILEDRAFAVRIVLIADLILCPFLIHNTSGRTWLPCIVLPMAHFYGMIRKKYGVPA